MTTETETTAQAETNGAALGRDAILGADDSQDNLSVAVPEWGGSVYIRMLTAKERDDFELSVAGDKRENIRAKLGVACMCDVDGKTLFTAEDVDALGAKSGVAMGRVLNAATKLNRLSDKDVEELAGN